VPPPSRTALGAAGLLALAVFLRAWGVADIPGYTGDEPLHVAQAEAFATGHGVDGAWWNPPLSYELLHASMSALGDGPWGRRARNVVLGALTPLLVALLGFSLFQERRRTGWIAGALLAVDPLHVTLSRGTFEEVQAAFFFVAAALAVVHAARGRPTLVLGGLALGCALASKHYFPLAALVLGAYALAPSPGPSPDPDRPPPSLATVILRLWLVAAAVYVATYLPWFGRGYGLGELVSFHLDVLRVQRSLDAAAFTNVHLPASGTAGEWFLVPSMLVVLAQPGETLSRYHALGRNFPAWLAVLPAAAAVALHALRRRSRPEALVVALFAAIYVPLLLAGRPIFVHSAVAVLPFALLAVARAADLLAGRWPRAAAAWLALALAFALFLYPLATARRVPDALYAPFLARMVLVDPR